MSPQAGSRGDERLRLPDLQGRPVLLDPRRDLSSAWRIRCEAHSRGTSPRPASDIKARSSQHRQQLRLGQRIRAWPRKGASRCKGTSSPGVLGEEDLVVVQAVQVVKVAEECGHGLVGRYPFRWEACEAADR